MNTRQLKVIIFLLFIGVALLLFAPERTFDLNRNRSVFYSYTWMPKYYQGDPALFLEEWKDRIYLPYLVAEFGILLVIGAGLFHLTRTRRRKRRG